MKKTPTYLVYPKRKPRCAQALKGSQMKESVEAALRRGVKITKCAPSCPTTNIMSARELANDLVYDPREAKITRKILYQEAANWRRTLR